MQYPKPIVAAAILTAAACLVFTAANAASSDAQPRSLKLVGYSVTDLPIHSNNRTGDYKIDTRLLFSWIESQIGTTPGFKVCLKGPYAVPQPDGPPVDTLFAMVTATPNAHNKLSERFKALRHPPIPVPDPKFFHEPSP